MTGFACLTAARITRLASGQFYVMSPDLSTFVVNEAMANRCSYCVGLEGLDVSTMAFFFPKPMKILMIGSHQQFWRERASTDPVLNITSNTGIARGRPSNLDGSSTGQQQRESKQQARGPRVLVGIFSTETSSSSTLRKRILSLFELRNDSRVCCFSDFLQLSDDERDGSKCELIYTFVMGAVHQTYNDTYFPTEIAGKDERPLVINASGSNATKNTVFLNIRENMNEGKSQTWFNYATRVTDKYEIDYVAKCDEDSIFDLPKYFQFTSDYLPRAPDNTGIYAGRVHGLTSHKVRDCREYRDTDPYSLGFPEPRNRSCGWASESLFDQYFDKVHPYVLGTQDCLCLLAVLCFCISPVCRTPVHTEH
jgi:hypothetical protein